MKTHFVASAMLFFTLANSPAQEKPMSYQEPYRPQFHFSPAQNWMNDPNGMVYYAGEYHLFYQYNPEGNKWGHMSWGHAVSADLVHWQHLPLALAEEDGIMIYSGSAVVDWKNTSGFGTAEQPPLVAIYTGRRNADDQQAQCLAYSNDRGRTWTKYRGNPVLDLHSNNFRDPKVFWHAAGAQWVMAVSLSAEHKIRFYRSLNLREWTHLSDFGPAGATGGVWECPDLFPLALAGEPHATKWVLLVNMNPGSIAGGSGVQYFIGDFDGTNFTVDATVHSQKDQALWVDYGKDYYAGVSWSDVPASDGRRLWLGWMSNWDYGQEVPTQPWRSAMSIPRALQLRRLREGVRLVQQPVAELQRLRAAHERAAATTLVPDKNLVVAQHLGKDGTELLAEFRAAQATEFGFKISFGDNEEVVVGYRMSEQKLFVDRTRAGNTNFHAQFSGVHAAPLPLPSGRLQLHIFMDRSSLEVFANDGEAVITDLIFPTAPAAHVAAFARGGTARLEAFEVWQLQSIWPKHSQPTQK